MEKPDLQHMGCRIGGNGILSVIIERNNSPPTDSITNHAKLQRLEKLLIGARHRMEMSLNSNPRIKGL